MINVTNAVPAHECALTPTLNAGFAVFKDDRHLNCDIGSGFDHAQIYH